MVVAIDKCTVRVRLRDVRGDDVNATTIIEKEKKNTCLLYMKMFSRKNPI